MHFRLQLDAALFQNRILDRITSAVRSSTSAVTISDTINNPGEIMLQGIELQAQLDNPAVLGIGRSQFIQSIVERQQSYFGFVAEAISLAQR